MTCRQRRSNSVPLIWGQASQSDRPKISARGAPKVASAALFKAVKRQSRSTAKKLSPIPSRSASTRESWSELLASELIRASTVTPGSALTIWSSFYTLHRIIRLVEYTAIFSLKTFLTIKREAVFSHGRGGRNE